MYTFNLGSYSQFHPFITGTVVLLSWQWGGKAHWMTRECPQIQQYTGLCIGKGRYCYQQYFLAIFPYTKNKECNVSTSLPPHAIKGYSLLRIYRASSHFPPLCLGLWHKFTHDKTLKMSVYEVNKVGEWLQQGSKLLPFKPTNIRTISCTYYGTMKHW